LFGNIIKNRLLCIAKKQPCFSIMKKYIIALIIGFSAVSCTQEKSSQDLCYPIPNQRQLEWQQMEIYAFLHYSLNTYTDQEWGFGNEDPNLFNPEHLDVKQWVTTCRNAGMKGIILTAKHHCGFCLWPSQYTEYSVKNSPWKEGKGDVVKELSEECRRQGLKFGVYLSPWDRNHAEYGRPEYITYFRNQLEELLTQYGDIFEVWFDGANGGDGWYGGANDTRKIDRTTYYEWPVTYRKIREWQPDLCIWNDGGERGDLRWVGTEAGYVGETNWSILNSTGPVEWHNLHYGLEIGDAWVPGEVNTSIRPGWFYHTYEDNQVKSLSKLMETYYKSVGRNATLLLNFPIMQNGLISPKDSLRGTEFKEMIEKSFAYNLAEDAKIRKSKVNPNDSIFAQEILVDLGDEATFNRIVLQEDIALGQRVEHFTVDAFVKGEWKSLDDMLAQQPGMLTTIGYKRIICFPTVTASQIRVNIEKARAVPHISNVGVYWAPELKAKEQATNENNEPKLKVFWPNGNCKIRSMYIQLEKGETLKGLRYLPPQKDKKGMPLDYVLWGSSDTGNHWTKLAEGEFSNIVNNPIWQTITFDPIYVGLLRLDCKRNTSGSRVLYEAIEVIKEE